MRISYKDLYVNLRSHDFKGNYLVAFIIDFFAIKYGGEGVLVIKKTQERIYFTVNRFDVGGGWGSTCLQGVDDF